MAVQWKLDGTLAADAYGDIPTKIILNTEYGEIPMLIPIRGTLADVEPGIVEKIRKFGQDLQNATRQK